MINLRLAAPTHTSIQMVINTANQFFKKCPEPVPLHFAVYSALNLKFVCMCLRKVCFGLLVVTLFFTSSVAAILLESSPSTSFEISLIVSSCSIDVVVVVVDVHVE